MTRTRTVFALFNLFFLFSLSAAQTGQSANVKPLPEKQIRPHVRYSPAYAEVLLRITSIEADVEGLALDYTEDYPKVKELRFELSVLRKATEALSVVNADSAGKLTLALGKLMVTKAGLETDLWELLQSYKEDHPDVKRAKRRVEIYDRAIKQIID